MPEESSALHGIYLSTSTWTPFSEQRRPCEQREIWNTQQWLVNLLTTLYASSLCMPEGARPVTPHVCSLRRRHYLPQVTMGYKRKKKREKLSECDKWSCFSLYCLLELSRYTFGEQTRERRSTVLEPPPARRLAFRRVRVALKVELAHRLTLSIGRFIVTSMFTKLPRNYGLGWQKEKLPSLSSMHVGNHSYFSFLFYVPDGSFMLCYWLHGKVEWQR